MSSIHRSGSVNNVYRSSQPALYEKDITSINLSNSLVNGQVPQIADQLVKSTTLELLDLSDNCFTVNSECETLLPALKQNKSLKTLNLSDNQLPAWGEKLGDLLICNSTLTSLNLEWIVADINGVKSILNKIPECRLTSLKISFQSCGSPASDNLNSYLVKLFKAVGKNATLKELDISRWTNECIKNEECMRTMQEVFNQHPTLLHIYFEMNEEIGNKYYPGLSGRLKLLK